MSQRDFMQAFDAMAIGAFVRAGIGDRARYYAPGAGVGVMCDALVDRGRMDFGDERAPLSVPAVTISLQLSQVQPVAGGRLVLLNDDDTEGEAWRLDAAAETSDESLSVWRVAVHG